jgi:hypothetical protein
MYRAVTTMPVTHCPCGSGLSPANCCSLPRLEAMANYWATPAASWLGDPVALRLPVHRTDDP